MGLVLVTRRVSERQLLFLCDTVIKLYYLFTWLDSVKNQTQSCKSHKSHWERSLSFDFLKYQSTMRTQMFVQQIFFILIIYYTLTESLFRVSLGRIFPFVWPQTCWKFTAHFHFSSVPSGVGRLLLATHETNLSRFQMAA